MTLRLSAPFYQQNCFVSIWLIVPNATAIPAKRQLYLRCEPEAFVCVLHTHLQ